MLTPYKPWKLNYDETKEKHPNFCSALNEYMWDTKFPRLILHSILKFRLNLSLDADIDEIFNMVCPENNVNEDDEDVPNYVTNNLDHIVTPVCEYDEHITDLAESDLCGSDTCKATYNWINNKYILLMGALNEYKKEY